MLIGAILVLHGFCSQEDIFFALKCQSEGDTRKLGEILIHNDVITKSQLDTALAIQRGE